MLYDWEKPSLVSFAAWLEQQPAETTYQWGDYNTCACGKYMESLTGNPTAWPPQRDALELLALGKRSYGELLEAVREKLRGAS
jgi:hypothetical protein